jgi:hypothetical protein
VSVSDSNGSTILHILLKTNPTTLCNNSEENTPLSVTDSKDEAAPEEKATVSVSDSNGSTILHILLKNKSNNTVQQF